MQYIVYTEKCVWYSHTLMRNSLHVWTFGKHKFDGPFTEKEEENVKTLFCLIPLLLFAIGLFLTLEFYDQLGFHAIVTTNKNNEILMLQWKNTTTG